MPAESLRQSARYAQKTLQVVIKVLLLALYCSLRHLVSRLLQLQAAEQVQDEAVLGGEPAEDWDTAWVDDAGAAFEVPWFVEDEEGGSGQVLGCPLLGFGCVSGCWLAWT